MKFAKQIEEQSLDKWAEHYLPYKRLKKLLKKARVPSQTHNVDSATDFFALNKDVSDEFLAALRVGLLSMNEFVANTRTEIETQRDEIQDRRQELQQPQLHDPQTLAWNRKQLISLESSVWHLAAELRDFVELNYTALYKIMKKHDKMTGIPLMEKVMKRVDQLPFMAVLEPPTATGAASISNTSDPIEAANLLAQFAHINQHEILQHLSAYHSASESDIQLPSPAHVENGIGGSDTEEEHSVSSVTAAEVKSDETNSRKTTKHSSSARSSPGDVELSIRRSSSVLSIPKLASELFSNNTASHELSVDQETSQSEVVQSFETQLARSTLYLQAALHVLCPELNDPAERQMKIERFAWAAKRALNTLSSRDSHSLEVYKLQGYALAAKLEMFRYMLKVLIREYELTFPEGAAALESLVHAHHELFRMYMSSRVSAPGAQRVGMLARMMSTSEARNVRRIFDGCIEDDVPSATNLNNISEADSIINSVSVAQHDIENGEHHEQSTSQPVAIRTSYHAEFPRVVRANSSGANEYSNTLSERQDGQKSTMTLGRATSFRRSSQPPKHPTLKWNTLPKPPKSSKFSARDDPTRLPSESNPLQHRSLAPHVNNSNREQPRIPNTSTVIAADTASKQPNELPMQTDKDNSKDANKPVFTGMSKAERRSEKFGLDTAIGQLIGVDRQFSLNANKAVEENVTSDTSHAAKSVRPDTVPVALTNDMDDGTTAVGAGSCWDRCYSRVPTSRPALKRALKTMRPAIFEWLPEYNTRKNFLKDLVAGLTGAVVVIPQGLAYAFLAGLPPQYGIYAGIVPGVIYGIFGASKHAAVGPMSIPSLMIASALQSMNPEPTGADYVRLVMTISLFVGIFSLLLGVFRFGFLVNFISRPVLKGFTSAAAVIASVSVLQDILGTGVKKSSGIHNQLYNLGKALDKTHWPTLVFGLLTLAFLISMKKKFQKIPAPLATVVICIVIMAIWYAADDTSKESNNDGKFVNSAGIQVIGGVPSDLPKPSIPSFSGEELGTLLPSVIAISFVAYIEHIAIVKMYSVKYGYEADASQELRAVGACNIGGAIFQSFPVMGGFSRSAVNVQAGARSQLALMLSSVFVLLLLLFITPVLFYLPKAVLAVLVITSVMGLVDYASARKLWHDDKRDLAVMSVAFFLTLFLGVQIGVIAAMGASLVLFIYVSTRARVAELGRVPGTVVYRHVGLVGVVRVPRVKIIKFYAPMFFANISALKDVLSRELNSRKSLPPKLQWKAMVLCLASVPSIDSTAVQILQEVVSEYHACYVPILLASPNSRVETILVKSGVIRKLGGVAFVYRRVHEAVRAVLISADELKKILFPEDESTCIKLEENHELENISNVESSKKRRRWQYMIRRLLGRIRRQKQNSEKPSVGGTTHQSKEGKDIEGNTVKRNETGAIDDEEQSSSPANT